MVDRVTIGPPGSILDWDSWGKPMTDAVNEHDVSIAALLLQLFAIKSADETVNNSAALQNDDHLFAQVAANAKYKIQVHLIQNSGATPGFKLDNVLPAGSTWRSGTFMCGSGTPNLQVGTMTTASISGIIGAGTDAFVDFWSIIEIGSTPGVVQLRWAQNAANASNTTVRAGSWLSLQRVA